MPSILIIDDEADIRRLYRGALARRGYDVLEAPGGVQALEILGKTSIDLIISDVNMPGISGFALLAELRSRTGERYVPVILVTGAHCLDEDLLRGYGTGADDYLFKPCNVAELCARVEARLRMARALVADAAQAAGGTGGASAPGGESKGSGPPGTGAGGMAQGIPGGAQPGETPRAQGRRAPGPARAASPPGAPLTGASAPSVRTPDLAAIFAQCDRIGPSKAPVLVTGETGSGKGVVARYLHTASPRKDGPFVPVHCTGIPPDLLASELFGHERGAYTGAQERRDGRCRLADGGTVFFDEVGDLTPAVQLALLRFCEDGEFERLGSAETIKVDARVVTATHRDLDRGVAEGRFREDLYYRLAVFTIRVPPLRERPRDIEALALHFLKRAAQRMGKPIEGIDDDALGLLRAHRWPGNVRELNNAIERAVVFTAGRRVTASDIQLTPSVFAGAPDHPGPGLAGDLEAIERARIDAALRKAGGNQSAAARELGLPRTTLVTKMRKLGIQG